MTAVNVLWDSATETFRSARTAPFPLPYTLLTASRRTAGTSPFDAGERFDERRLTMSSTVRGSSALRLG
jgi:hypothetical protein